MTNTTGRVESTNQGHGKVRMTVRRLASITRDSMLAIAATLLAACGGGSNSGSPTVSVPNVVGDTQAAASTAITAAGLTVGTVTQSSSATVAAGNVISETPAAGTSAASGSSVALVVSTGPATVSVPNVVGETQAAATTALTGAGLTVGTVTRQSSSSVASGDVITQNPAAATSVAKGSTVALVVSSGPPTYAIGGTLIGLAPSATVHVLNGTDSVAISANGSFTFPTGIVSGGTYSVTVGAPSSTQTCAVLDGSGTVAAAEVTSVVVYCTYKVSAATLHNTYTTVAADFGATDNGASVPVDLLATQTYDGVGTISGTATVNAAGTIVTNVSLPGTYTVTTTNAIPALNGSGGIEGINGDALVGVSTTSGTPPTVAIGVLPNANATTDSVNGNYTQVTISAAPGTGDITSSEGTITLTNGTVTGTLTSNSSGTITAGNQVSGQFTIVGGIVTLPGDGAGAVSADGDLAVVADTNSGDQPNISVLVPKASGVTLATFEGVYSVVKYAGDGITATSGRAITLFAYGNGTFFATQTTNSQGTIGTGTDSGTYTVSADGTLTITDADGIVSTGAISADGNALVLGNITSGELPAIFVGVRQ